MPKIYKCRTKSTIQEKSVITMSLQDKNNALIQIRLPKWVKDALDKSGVNVSSVVRELLVKELAKSGIRKPSAPRIMTEEEIGDPKAKYFNGSGYVRKINA
jgi:hypothetical protein